LAADKIAGLAKVRVIKQVEKFRAQLKRHSFTKFCGLGNRSVSVVERGTYNYVSA